jgi:hypothetical protein
LSHVPSGDDAFPGDAQLVKHCSMTALTLIFSVLLSGIIHRCDMSDGATEYRDLPCPEGAGGVDAEWAAPATPLARTAPSNRPANGLSQAEVRALAKLQQRLVADAAQAKRQRSARQRRGASRAIERRRHCDDALSRMASLRVQKRRGYSSKDAARLDAEQMQLESIIDADC